MNEQYLQNFYNSYVKPSRPESTYEDWVTKVKDNDSYKQGMFNTYVKNSRPDADYADWNSKIFGLNQPEEERSFLGAIPVVGDIIHYGGKSLENVVTNQIPEAFQTLRLQGHSAKAKELEHLSQLEGISPEARANVQQELQGIKSEVPGIQQSIAKQKQESAKLLEHNIQNVTDINSVSSFMNWLGTSVAQVGGQIPLSIGTAGMSSVLLEAAEVYDIQLDLLAKKHGISRDQVVEQGLDKPAEGEVYALLAGALDAVSAGKILSLFKNIGRQSVKQLAKGTVKKSILKEAVQDGAFEALTEGTQGQLEQLGASRGAGTEYHFDPKQFLNEAAAGAVGGAGIGMASSNLEGITTKKDTHPTKAAIEDYEKTINSISTGDPSLDASLDEISESTAREIDALWEKAHTIAGTKTQEELKATREENARLKLEKRQSEQEQLGRILRGELTQLPALPHPGFKTSETFVPKYNPQTLEEEGSQPAQKFDFQLPHGSAQGTIVGPYASLDTIYTNKDEQGNPIKGKNLYGSLLNQLKLKGVKTLTVGNQTTASANALKKLVDNEELSVDPKGDVTFGDKTIHTRFNILKPYEQQTEPQGTPETSGSQEIAPNQANEVNAKSSEEKRVLTKPEHPLITTSKNLRTFDLGNLEGAKQTPSEDKALHNTMVETPDEPMSEGGETFNQASKRVINSISKVTKSAPDNTVIVTHNSVFGIIKLWDKSNRPKSFDRSQRVEYTKQDNKFSPGSVFKIKGDNDQDIWIVRHGETEDNKLGNFRSKNTDLTEKGVRDAEKVGKELSNKVIPQVISSNLPRALHTANIIMEEQKDIAPVKSEQQQDLEIILKKRLENAKKRAPSRRLAAIEKVIQKAEEAGLDKFAKVADEESKKAFEESQAKEEEKQELKEFKTKRAETKAAKAAEVKPTVEKKPSKLEAKIEGTQVALKTAKEAFLRDIAYLRESGKAEYKQRAEQYLKFRKKQGLKETTLEKVLSESKAEHYIQRAQSRIAKETSRAHAISQRIKQMTKEGAPVEEISKVKESLETELKKEIQKSLGVDLDTLTGASLDKLLSTPEFIYSVRNLTGEGIKKNRLKHSSVEELSRRLSNLPDARSADIINLLNAVNNALLREGKTLNILSYHSPSPHTSGFYARGKKQDILLIASKLDANGNFSLENKDAINTVLHELTHTLSDLLSRLSLQGDRNYSRDLGELYDKSKSYLDAQIVNIVNKEIEGKSLNEHELNLMAAIFSNIEKFYGRSRVEFIDRAIREKSDPHIVGAAIVNSLYGFANKNEMASEALASYKFARLLDLIPYTGRLETTKSDNKTVLTALFDKIAKVLNKYVGKFFPGKSSFNVFNDILETYADQLSSEPNLQKFNPYFYAPTLKDIERQYPKLSKKEVIAKREEIAAKMAKDESSVGFSKKVKAGEFTEEIVSNISRTLENRSEIKTVADVHDYIERVNKRLATEKQLGNAYAEVIFKKLQVLRRRRQIAKTFVNNTLNKARQSEKYQNSFKYKKDVDDFQSVNVDAVPQYRLTDLRQAVDALSRDMLVSEDGYNIMINYGKKLAKVKALVKIAPKIDQHVNLGGLLGTEQLSNASTFSTILGRYDKATSTEILRHIYGGMMETFAHVGTEAHKFTTALSKIADSHNLTHSNLAKIAMYGSVFSTKNDPRNTTEWEKEVLDNAKFAVESAINKKTAKGQSNYKGDLNRKEIDKEIEIATSLYDKLKNKPSMDNILDKGETEFYQHFTKFAKDHEQDFFRNSFGAWGSDIEPRFNYFPTMAQGKVNGVLSNENDELIRNNKDNLFEALGLHDIKSDKSAVYAKKSNSQYKRQNPKGYFYNFDAMNIAERWSKNMLYDLYATTELKALNRLFKDPEFRKNINVKTTDAFVKQIRSIAGVGNKYDSELPAFFKVMGNLYTATLATSGQIFNQSSSGFAAAAVIAAHGGLNAPKNFAKAVSAAFSSTFSTDTSKLNQFMKDNGLGIQVRDILFEKYLGSDDYKSYLGSKLQKFRNTMQNMTEWSLRKGDKLGARVVWFAAYFNAGGTLEKPNKEAILEAERQVGIMQNMSDMNFSAPLFKYDNMYKKILMGMFYAYKSFSVNAYVNLLYSAKNINKPEAREAMGAQLASVVAYHAIAASLVKPLIYDPLINALTGGDDDDKDKEEKRYSLGQQIMAESLWDLGAFTPLFGMAAPGISDAAFRWLFSETLAKKIYEDESGIDAYNKYLDNPIYSMKNAEDIWKQAFGPGYREMGETTIAAMQYVKMQADADEFFADMEKADKADQALDELRWRLGATLWAATPFAPFGGDFKRITNARIQKNRARNLSSPPTGNTNGEIDSEGTETIEGTPEIEEKNYEIVNE